MTHHDVDLAARAADARTPDERQADHAAIDRLADELLPALVAKLGASGLGELTVREGAWRVRLRMPGDGRGSRRSGGSGSRATGRSEGHGGAASPPFAAPVASGSVHEPISTDPGDPEAGVPTRAIATAPAVGFFRPQADLAPGARVRAGDRLGAIDVLGVPHEVASPVDGIVGASFVEAGDPVEYGQEIVEIELLGAPGGARAEGT